PYYVSIMRNSQALCLASRQISRLSIFTIRNKKLPLLIFNSLGVVIAVNIAVYQLRFMNLNSTPRFSE
ncbi:MAG: hypothetical protein ACRD6Q_06995, partial [Nitrososphaeraceae archaeon]